MAGAAERPSRPLPSSDGGVGPTRAGAGLVDVAAADEPLLRATPTGVSFGLVTGGTTNIPASLFQAINPLLIVALAPTLSNLWDRLDNSKYRMATPTKMAIGMIILGLGFLVLFAGQSMATATGAKASAAWLVAVYAIHTTG